MKSLEEIKRDNNPRSKRKRSRTVLRRLNTAALATMGYDRPKAEGMKLPSLAVHFGLVPHGYEIHVFNDGKYIGAGCRDFSGNHKVEDLKQSLMQTIEDAVKAWRAKL